MVRPLTAGMKLEGTMTIARTKQYGEPTGKENLITYFYS